MTCTTKEIFKTDRKFKTWFESHFISLKSEMGGGVEGTIGKVKIYYCMCAFSYRNICGAVEK